MPKAAVTVSFQLSTWAIVERWNEEQGHGNTSIAAEELILAGAKAKGVKL